MRAIVTRPNEDGSYDEIGTNNRMVTGVYKTLKNLVKFGVPFWKGKLRVEVYADSIHQPAIKVIYVKGGYVVSS